MSKRRVHLITLLMLISSAWLVSCSKETPQEQSQQQVAAAPEQAATSEESTRPVESQSTSEVEKDIFVIRGVVLDAKGLPQSGEITLFRKTSAPKGMPFGGVEAPWRDADAPDNLFLEIEGELKDRKFNVLNPKTKTDGKGRFTLEVKRSFIGDAKDCTLTVGISRPRGGIVPQKLPRSGGAPLVFECPSRAAPELDLGELRLE